MAEPWEPSKKEIALDPNLRALEAEKLNMRLARKRNEQAARIINGDEPNGTAAEWLERERMGQSRT